MGHIWQGITAQALSPCRVHIFFELSGTDEPPNQDRLAAAHLLMPRCGN